MDNITHSLVGIAAGEGLAQLRKKDRLPLWIASAAANNLPDLDVLITSFFLKGKTNYLLHHRGHTHTFLLSPVLSLILFAGLWLLWRRRPNFPWKEVLFLCLLGPFLHIFADFWNSYGVHPLWPWNNQWFYGDMVFIVEPWIWTLLLPAIFFAAKKTGKAVSVMLTVVILALAWIHEYVPWPIATGLTVATGCLFFLFGKISSAGLRIGISLSCLGAFLGFSYWAPHDLRSRFPAGTTKSLALTPLPANPLCFTAIYSQFNDGKYVATISQQAIFPQIFPVNQCPNFYPEKITAPLERLAPTVGEASREEFAAKREKITGTFTAPISELETLWQNCRIRAFFRFLRNPFWVRQEGGWLVGDLRYDRDASVGFVEEFFPDSETTCIQWEPPWVGRFHPERFLE
jgi:inner membrane protein